VRRTLRRPSGVACVPRRSFTSGARPRAVPAAPGPLLMGRPDSTPAGPLAPRMGSSSTPVPVRRRRRLRRELGAAPDSGSSGLLFTWQAPSAAATVAGSKRSRGRGPSPSGIAPSWSACARTHAEVTPKRCATSAASMRFGAGGGAGRSRSASTTRSAVPSMTRAAMPSIRSARSAGCRRAGRPLGVALIGGLPCARRAARAARAPCRRP
jgi:hypothetical protein